MQEQACHAVSPRKCSGYSRSIKNPRFKRRAPVTPRGKMKRIRSARPLIASFMLILSQLACQTLFPGPATATATILPPTPTVVVPTSTVTPSRTPVPEFSDDEIKVGIQRSLDIYAEALTNNNPEQLAEVVDQENKPFRRIVRSRFDEFQNSYAGGQVQFQFTLKEITRRAYGFVIARFETDNGLEAQWPFRYLNGAWVISEPTVEQIGEPVTTETEHFTFTSYPWAEDVNPLIMKLMEKARQNVED